MVGLFRNIFLYIVAAIAIAIILPADAGSAEPSNTGEENAEQSNAPQEHKDEKFNYRDPDPKRDYGAVIMNTNCDPSADPNLDYLKTDYDVNAGVTYYPTRSCISQNISIDATDDLKKYKVHVIFRPTPEFILAYVLANLSPLIALQVAAYTAVFASTAGKVTTSCLAGCLACVVACGTAGFNAGMQAGNAYLVGWTGSVITALTLVGGYALVLNAADATEKGDVYLNVGSLTGLVKGPLGPLANANVEIKGQYACVKMTSYPIPFTNFGANRTPDFDSEINYNIGASSPLQASDKKNCVYMPLMSEVPRPKIPAFVSAACLDNDQSATQFRWPPIGGEPGNTGKGRSFTGMVVQCVQESMMNLFFNKHGDDTQTIFEKLQRDLQYLVMLMMVLYVMFIGFKYISHNQGALKQQEFIMMMLKIGIVWYFALGGGAVSLFPYLINSIQTVGAIVVDAAAIGDSYDSDGKTITMETIKKNEDDALKAYNLARDDYNNARRIVSLSEGGAAIPSPKAKDDAYAAYKKANLISLSYGYNYCNFRPFVEHGLYEGAEITVLETTEVPYNAVSPDPGTLLSSAGNSTYTSGDNSYMQLWDSIDCRIAKYLGIGSDNSYPSHPATLMWATASILAGPLGLMVSILIVIFLIFMILIILRVVHIYIIAIFALILLFYISPLAIAMILFKFTKGTTDAWIKQIFSYSLQPIILFTFLAFMFAMFDNIIYGENHTFNQTSFNGNTPTISLNDNTLARTQDAFGNWRCQDESVIGCMIENIGVGTKTMTVHDAITNKDNEILRYYVLHNKKILGQYIFPEAGNSTNAAPMDDISQAQYAKMLVEMLKLIFMCFVIYYIMKQVEELVVPLTNSAMSSTNLASAPTADPKQIAESMSGAGKKIAGVGTKLGKMASSSADYGVGKSKNTKRAGVGGKGNNSQTQKTPTKQDQDKGGGGE